MARPLNPLSKRNESKTFTGAQVKELLAKSKRAQKIRESSEFKIANLRQEMRLHTQTQAVYSWTLDDVLEARNAQMRGDFSLPVRLAESMRTGDAIFTARSYRLAPQQELSVEMISKGSTRADSIAEESKGLFGNKGIGIRIPTASDLNGYLADLGVAVGYNEWRPRATGDRIDVIHHAFPMEWVKWDPTRNCLVARTRDGFEEIRHGDGRWTVYASHEITPWKQRAAILPGSLVWAMHAFAGRDWGQASGTHGNAKVIGELPEGVPMRERSEDGTEALSPDVLNFLAALEDIAGHESMVGVIPQGAKVDILAHPGRAWEVFSQWMTNREKAAYRIYLGTDALLGAMGGAPGVDIAQLIGVARVIISGDLLALSTGFQEGVIDPWTAVNFGDSSLAPQREYVLPQPDEQAVHTDFAERHGAFLSALESCRTIGIVLTPEYIAILAKEYGVPIPIISVPVAPPVSGKPSEY
jgi:hypothetical protein